MVPRGVGQYINNLSLTVVDRWYPILVVTHPILLLSFNSNIYSRCHSSNVTLNDLRTSTLLPYAILPYLVFSFELDEVGQEILKKRAVKISKIRLKDIRAF